MLRKNDSKSAFKFMPGILARVTVRNGVADQVRQLKPCLHGYDAGIGPKQLGDMILDLSVELLSRVADSQQHSGRLQGISFCSAG